MLNSVIIVLRETMEASLLVGFLFIFSDHLSMTKYWLVKALIMGIILAIVVANLLPLISDFFDGVGQEVLFSSVLLTLSLLIQWTILILLLFPNWLSKLSVIQALFVIIITLAISLEGAEIIVFIQSGLSNKDKLYPILVGGTLGIGIGFSIGAIGYYLISLSLKWRLYVSGFFLSLLSAGMISQAIAYMMQADFIDSSYPIWNSNQLVDERSIFGQLLYAITGYESTPSLLQVVFYAAFIIIPLLIALFRCQKANSEKNRSERNV